MAPTEEQQRTLAWIDALDFNALDAAPDQCPARLIDERSAEGHDCIRCGDLARVAYVATSRHGMPMPPRWVDLCPPCASKLRAALEAAVSAKDIMMALS